MHIPANVEAYIILWKSSSVASLFPSNTSLNLLHASKPSFANILLYSVALLLIQLSTIWANASIAVSQITFKGAFLIYFSSTKAILGNILWDIDFLVFSLCTVKTATVVTSEPVPHVVGTSITGKDCESETDLYKKSLFSFLW